MSKMKILVVSVVLTAFAAVSVFAKDFEVIEPIMPDNQSAVVYFIGSKAGVVFDGKTPIGDFSKLKKMTNLAYKTTPGEHFFGFGETMGVTSVIKANLQANRRYYVKVDFVPVPFAPLYIMNVLSTSDGAASVADSKRQTVRFPAAWQEKFSNNKKKASLIKKIEENIQEAKQGKKEAGTLGAANGH